MSVIQEMASSSAYGCHPQPAQVLTRNTSSKLQSSQPWVNFTGLFRYACMPTCAAAEMVRLRCQQVLSLRHEARTGASRRGWAIFLDPAAYAVFDVVTFCITCLLREKLAYRPGTIAAAANDDHRDHRAWQWPLPFSATRPDRHCRARRSRSQVGCPARYRILPIQGRCVHQSRGLRGRQRCQLGVFDVNDFGTGAGKPG